MSLVKNNSESERIQKIKDKTIFANYTVGQTRFQQGCDPYPKSIQSGSGSSNESSVLNNIRQGEVFTTPAELDVLLATNACATTSSTSPVVPVVPVVNGSLLFDGSTSHLLYSGITVGANAFTFECWFNITGNIGLRNVIFGAKYVSVANSEFSFASTGATSFTTDQLGVSARTYIVPTMTANTWYHVAVCRDASNNETVFLNGVRATTGSLIDAVNYKLTRYIGTWDSGGTGLSNFFGGTLAGLRVVIGSTVYNPLSATITVPTQPLPNVTNCVLLMNTPVGDNYLTDTSASAFTFTNTNVTSSALHP